MKVYEHRDITRIEIDLDNGLYIFHPWDADGKTYLCNELKRLQVIGYTYHDYKVERNLWEMIDTVKPEVIMLDRADLYGEDPEILDTLRKAQDNAVVLVTKADMRLGNLDYDLAGVEFDENRIEVY